MKLLTKQEIVREKSLERKNEIDEGVKLARRVDTLRQTVAKEEANLNKFRDESLKILRNDLETLQKQKEVLVSQINELDEQKRILRIPLDSEWVKVETRKKEIQTDQELLNEKVSNLLQKEQNYALNIRELLIEQERTKDERSKASQNLIKSSENLAFSEKIISETQAKRKENDEYFAQKNKELLSREAQIAISERELKLKEDQIDKERSGLITRTILIQDREQTLERELKRQQKYGSRRPNYKN